MCWTDEKQVEERKKNKPLKGLLVYYGFTKLTKKAIRKREFVVVYENANNNSIRNEKFMRKFHIVHIRKQTKEEINDAYWSNRTFTKYGTFIDDRRWKGDINRILHNNFIADKNHVSKKERNIIKEKLLNKFIELWGKPTYNYQLEFEF